MRDGVGRYGEHRPLPWWDGDQLMTDGEVTTLLPRFGRAEPFAEIVEIECVQVDDVRPLREQDAQKLSLANLERFAGPGRHDQTINEPQTIHPPSRYGRGSGVSVPHAAG